MTEQEAKTKWCPMYRVCGSEPADNRPWKPNTGTPPNVGVIDARVAGCIGSACMAWRVHEGDAFKLQAERMYRDHGKRIKSDEGYCGLAGKP